MTIQDQVVTFVEIWEALCSPDEMFGSLFFHRSLIWVQPAMHAHGIRGPVKRLQEVEKRNVLFRNNVEKDLVRKRRMVED